MAFNKQYALVGVGTSEVTSVPYTGAYYVDAKIQVPRLAAGATAASQCVCTVTNVTQSTTLFTSAAGADGVYVDFNANANDVIRVALTSSAPVDQVLNNSVKAEIDLGSGQ